MDGLASQRGACPSGVHECARTRAGGGAEAGAGAGARAGTGAGAEGAGWISQHRACRSGMRVRWVGLGGRGVAGRAGVCWRVCWGGRRKEGRGDGVAQWVRGGGA